MPSKKAQVGETMTWVVATIIIIVILTISIFVSTAYLGGGKNVNFFKRTDVLVSKSLFSYLLTNDSEGSLVYNQLRNEENLNEFNGNLAINIFQKFYGEEYGAVWLGFVLEGIDSSGEPNSLSNEYLGSRPKNIGFRNTKAEFTNPKVSEEIQLNENKFVEFVLAQLE